MCGIVGYIGYRNAADVCMEGLLRLEYRGYDSFGIAAVSPEITLFKETGKISAAKDAVNLKGTCGIGHTRWATHGEPSDVNSHPHVSMDGRFSIVHNGIIENYEVLKKEYNLILKSDTDTEVVAEILEKAVLSGRLSESRIDDACQRVLDMKEKLGMFNGKYHVLEGLINPLDGINPEDIGLEKLLKRIKVLIFK